MKFSLATYEKFIELVRGNPSLYDPSLKDHKDQILQQNVWKKIATEMGQDAMTWQDWKKVWRQKRDGFVRKRKEIRNVPSGSAAKEIQKIPLYDQMSFLIPFTEGRSTDSNFIFEVRLEFSPYGEEIEIDEAQEPASPSSFLSDAPSSSFVEAAPMRAMSRKRPPLSKGGPMPKMQKTNMADLVAQINKRATASANAMEKMTQFMHEPEEDNFLAFLSKKVSSFSKSTQDWLEDKAMSLYREAKRQDKAMQIQESPIASQTGPQNMSSYHQNTSNDYDEQPSTIPETETYYTFDLESN